MKYFFDTSVLVAATLTEHMHHRPSLAVYAKADKRSAVCSAHTLAELYSTVTRIPGNQRMSGEQALVVIEDMKHRLEIVALSEHDYRLAIASAAAVGIQGGAIYDALIAHCALKSRASTIYTWNLSDFQRLGPEVARLVRNP